MYLKTVNVMLTLNFKVNNTFTVKVVVSNSFRIHLNVFRAQIRTIEKLSHESRRKKRIQYFFVIYF